MCTVTTFLRHNCTYLGVTASPKVVLTGCAWQQRYKKGKQRKQGLRDWVAIVLELDWQKILTQCVGGGFSWILTLQFLSCASVHELFLFTLSQMLGMLVLALALFLSLPLSRLASLSHSHSLGNEYPLSLRNIEACVEAHTIAIKLLSNTCGPNVYVSF